MSERDSEEEEEEEEEEDEEEERQRETGSKRQRRDGGADPRRRGISAANQCARPGLDWAKEGEGGAWGKADGICGAAVSHSLRETLVAPHHRPSLSRHH